jgi:hypothetical protein
MLMLVATAAFACTTAFAQAGGGAGSGAAGSSGSISSNTSQTDQNGQAGNQDQGTTATTSGKHHKKGSSAGMSGKTSTLTGCLSASPNSDGMYTLSNGRYKSGVEVGPTDKVKDHAGHQVALKGKWGTAAEAGENTGVAASTSEKGEKHFDVESVKHLSDTCKEASGGGTMGHKGHSKKGGTKSGDTTGGATTPPPSL